MNFEDMNQNNFSGQNNENGMQIENSNINMDDIALGSSPSQNNANSSFQNEENNSD